jgi:probable F420-dependent oxidoreductase
MTGSDVSFGLLMEAVEPAAVAELEAQPFDALWVGGHVASPNPSPEALVQLAQLAALTTGVRIGTSALLLPLYPPTIVAKQVADLDRATGGRVTLGVGVGGEYPQEFEACGVPIEERGGRTDEAISLLRRLWSAESVAHKGRYHSMADVRIHPAPAQIGGPPIVVAGRRAPAMRRAATLGDGWMPYLYSPERYQRSVVEIGVQAQRAGRDLAGFQWMAFVFANVQDSAGTAREDAGAFLGSNFRRDMGPLLDRIAAVGTPGDVARRLEAFVAAGARHLILAPATRGDWSTQARRLASDVVPGLISTAV